MGLGKATSSFFVRILNFILLLIGTATLLYGVVVIVKSASTIFTTFILSLGGFIVLTALVGLYSAGSASQCLVCFYLVLLGLLVVFQLTVVILLFAAKDWTIEQINSTAQDPKHVHEVQDFVLANLNVVKYVYLIIIGAELFTGVCACCLRNYLVEESIRGEVDEFGGRRRYSFAMKSKQPLLASNESRYSSHTPLTDERRKYFAQKYGAPASSGRNYNSTSQR